MGKKDKRIYLVTTRVYHFDNKKVICTDYNNFPYFRSLLRGYKRYLFNTALIDFYNRYNDSDDVIGFNVNPFLKRVTKKDCHMRDTWNDICPACRREMKSWKRRTKRKCQYTLNNTERYVKRHDKSINT